MVLDTTRRITGIAVTAIICYLTISSGLTRFSLHPILMSIGVRKWTHGINLSFISFYFHQIDLSSRKSQIVCLHLEQVILLLAEGAHAFRTDRHYKKSVLIHWILQLTGAAFIGLGFYSIYAHKNEQNFEHFVSQHANTGLTTLLILVGTSIGGTVARYSPLFWKTFPQLLWFKQIHSAFGVIALSMAMYSIILALDTAWFRNQTSVLSYSVIFYLTLLNALLIIVRPVLSLIHKARLALFKRR